jgi:PEP-CTERM motif
MVKNLLRSFERAILTLENLSRRKRAMGNVRTAFALVHGVVFLFAVAAPSAKANTVGPWFFEGPSVGNPGYYAPAFTVNGTVGTLLGAPNVGGSFYGMDQVDIAAEFGLSSSEYVTTIDVVLLGGSGAPPNGGLYDFALQNSLTAPFTTFASAVFSVPTAGRNTETITVDTTLGAGTYYLVASKNPADTIPGWWLSDGTYVTTAGSVTNGAWAAGVLSTSIPEPSTFLLLGIGLLGTLGFAGRRRRFDHSGRRGFHIPIRSRGELNVCDFLYGTLDGP